MKSLKQHLTSDLHVVHRCGRHCKLSLRRLHAPAGIIDGYFLLLTLVTAVIGSRIAIRIPQINVNITVDDTFVFIALLLYGGEAAVIIGRTGGCLLGAENQPQGQDRGVRQRRPGVCRVRHRDQF